MLREQTKELLLQREVTENLAKLAIIYFAKCLVFCCAVVHIVMVSHHDTPVDALA